MNRLMITTAISALIAGTELATTKIELVEMIEDRFFTTEEET